MKVIEIIYEIIDIGEMIGRIMIAITFLYGIIYLMAQAGATPNKFLIISMSYATICFAIYPLKEKVIEIKIDK